MDDKSINIEFPQKGVAVDAPVSDQQPGTTPAGVNVRFHEVLTNRGRGGSRAGLSRFIDEQVSGDNRIQMLDFVVRTDGNALGWEFQAEEWAATGLYLGLDLTGIAGDSQPSGGGGGYQPSASFSDNRIRLSLATSHTTRNVGDSITITGTVTDHLGAPVGLRRVRLHTSAGGRSGDHDIATSSIGTGQATFVVANTQEETVRYLGTVEDAIGRPETRSRNAVQCAWTEETTIVLLTRFSKPAGPGAPINSSFMSIKVNGTEVDGHTYDMRGPEDNVYTMLETLADLSLLYSITFWPDPGGTLAFDGPLFMPEANFVSGANTLRFANEGAHDFTFTGTFSLIRVSGDGTVLERLYEVESVGIITAGSFLDFPFTL